MAIEPRAAWRNLSPGSGSNVRGTRSLVLMRDRRKRHDDGQDPPGESDHQGDQGGPYPEALSRQFMGGAAAAIKLLYDEVDPRVDALGPENKLILSLGFLAGTSAPATSRVAFVGKSPLSGAVGYANSGGFFPNELRATGVQAIISEGKADAPVYLESPTAGPRSGTRQTTGGSTPSIRNTTSSRPCTTATSASRASDRPASTWSGTPPSSTSAGPPGERASGR
jgi:hypothetical protein